MQIADMLVLALYAAVMVGVGAYYSRTNKSADDYLLGGRALSPIALGLSLFATLVSTLSYLAHPGEMIAHGPMMATMVAAHPGIFLIVGFGLIPLLMRQPVTSAYELLETRLGTSIRMAGAGVFLLLRLGWMATILFATSKLVLVPLLKLDPSWTAPLCVMLGVLTAVYSSSGGLKAVVMTDAIQSITMLAGAVATLIVVSRRMGGIDGWWPTLWPEHWQSPNWGFDPEARVSFGVLMLSTTLWYVCTNGSDQMSIQRFLSTRDARAARRTLFVSQFTDALVLLLLGVTGLRSWVSTTPIPRRWPRGDPGLRGGQVVSAVHHDGDAGGTVGVGAGGDPVGRLVEPVVRRELRLRGARTGFSHTGRETRRDGRRRDPAIEMVDMDRRVDRDLAEHAESVVPGEPARTVLQTDQPADGSVVRAVLPCAVRSVGQCRGGLVRLAFQRVRCDRDRLCEGFGPAAVDQFRVDHPVLAGHGHWRRLGGFRSGVGFQEGHSTWRLKPRRGSTTNSAS